MTEEQEKKLANKKRETWINNVMKVYGWDREKAEKEHDKIHQPFYGVKGIN